MDRIVFKPIGRVHSPFSQTVGMPIQPGGARGVAGSVVLYDEFTGGLADLDGFSHIILLYHFHLSRGYSLQVRPFLDETKRGVFSTRAPRRPNPLGLSIVKLVGVEGNTLHIENVDILDGTPLLDIKPYVPGFDAAEADRIGWLSDRVGEVGDVNSDGRFGPSAGV